MQHMRTSDFDYHLPTRAIGQPPPRRDASRLLVLDRKNGRIAHRMVQNLPALLERGDLLVVNDTKVFRARLHGTVDGKSVEFLLVRPDGDAWVVLGKPGKRFRIGTTVMIGKLRGIVRERMEDGSVRIAFDRSTASVIAYANRIGEIPTPPYVTGSVQRLTDYQTAYARHVGSVAAPTAGFHLTPRLLARLRAKGVRIARVTLHVGLGTFQPIRTERIEDHVMHAEWAEVPAATARAITRTKARGGRIIAVGTTTLRTLEGVAALHRGTPVPHRGHINLFIAPGFQFRVVDALLTNFHLPKSSLLVLVSAFTSPGSRTLRGRDLILRAYRSALRRGYRFYSFGDAMVIQ
ncbi:MAG: tRNA preQ1(34) S-adenosylmethionine ribosyltransferase-isomerase QueA [bacterium]|nr:tRNA preQ1(34) S-adenosylmethionine ribosyltransferase-isomerase QueA [bacterium]